MSLESEHDLLDLVTQRNMRIKELEEELRTAKRDGIKEAIDECQFNFMGDIALKACLVSSLLKYAKEL